jgi:IclR family KDG regulon transcriptional repressor
MLQEMNVESVQKPKAVAEKTRLSSVANAIRLVKTFSDDDYEIGISNLAKRLLLPKSTVHRLASTLIDAGLLEQNPENGKYHLGLVVFELGSLVRRKMDFSAEAKPYLMSLREKTGETVHLAILDYSSILCVNTLESKQTIRMTLDVGRRKPAYCTAEGKVLLAYQTPEVVERMLSGQLLRRTPNTIVDEQELRQELIAIRSRGYAVDDEESEQGLRSLAAPVRNYTGDVIAATSIAGPSQRLTKKILLSFATDVVTASEAISQRLGYNPARARRRI